MKRRTNAVIQTTRNLHEETSAMARAINTRLGLEESPVVVKAREFWAVRANFQEEAATDFIVRVTTKDAVLAEKLAAAMKAVCEAHQVPA